MTAKTAFDAHGEGEITEVRSNDDSVSAFSGGEKLLESCVALRSSLSHLLAGNSNTQSVEAELSANLKARPTSVVGAQVGNLIEYVELYCLASLRGAFNVRAAGVRGTLWFDGGQLVHAQVGSVSGEDAALEILSWGTGTLTPSTAPFPVEPSIESPWQSLVLKAEAWRDLGS